MRWTQTSQGTTFSPRKGIIVHVFEEPLEREAVAVELVPAHLGFSPYRHKITHIILQYFHHGQQSILETFRVGWSYAEILELRNKKALNIKALTKSDLSHLGAADVFPWPKPSEDELSKNLEEWKKRTSTV